MVRLSSVPLGALMGWCLSTPPAWAQDIHDATREQQGDSHNESV